MWGEPMRPIDELCAVGVDLHRAPRAAVDDFLENRAEPRKGELPPRSRGRGNARYLTREQRHRRMLEGSERRVPERPLLYMYSIWRSERCSPRLPPEIEQRLDALARKTGRTKSFYAREAILRQIEDIEDYYLARRRLARGGSRVTLESLERGLKRRTKK